MDPQDRKQKSRRPSPDRAAKTKPPLPQSADDDMRSLDQRRFDDKCLEVFPGDVERARRLFGAYTFIRKAFLERLDEHRVGPEEAGLVLDAALTLVAPKIPEPIDNLPDLKEAPELWAKRDLNLRETAPDFIRRVYGSWLGRGLQRRHFKVLDDDLYKALSVWVSRHPADPIVDVLPARKGQLDDLIDTLSARYPVELLRRVGYAIDARHRRRDPAD